MVFFCFDIEINQGTTYIFSCWLLFIPCPIFAYELLPVKLIILFLWFYSSLKNSKGTIFYSVKQTDNFHELFVSKFLMFSMQVNKDAF